MIARIVVLACIVVAGCDSSDTTTGDMAVAPDDLAVAADLAPTSDLATNDLDVTVFCDHLRAALAGGASSDCAVEFMARMMRCFQPAGACGTSYSFRSSTSCWSNGAAFQDTHALLGAVSYGYAMGGRRCGTISADTGGPYSAGLCASTAQYDCHPESTTDMAGAVAQYLGGTFTCPDGTQLAVGPLFNCPEVKQFLAPACDGSVDAGGCVVP